jgi:TonB family protein
VNVAPQFFALVLSGALVIGSIGLSAQADIAPARYQDGSLPRFPVQAVSGGEVLLSVSVSSAGAVDSIDVLRSTPPFIDAVVAAVRGWHFAPGEDPQRKPMASKVLVGAVFGAPSLNVPTTGQPPKDIDAGPSSLPWPVTAPVPQYPQNARSGGAVLVETLVAPNGKVVGVTALRSAPPFDDPAMNAAQRWLFRPAQGAGLPPSAYVYLIFEFRPPVIGAAPK